MTDQDGALGALPSFAAVASRHRSLAWRAAALCDAIACAGSQDSEFQRAVRAVSHCLIKGGTVFTAGNGGSAAQAQHLAAELVGRLSASRARGPLSARSLSADVTTLTALANDYGYTEVFARQVAATCRAGDVLCLISTSGQSDNLIAAATVARQLNIVTLALIGGQSSPLDRCDVVLRTSGADPGTVQEVHLLLVHALTEAIEDEHVRLAARKSSEGHG
jgi:phosphoheptose isomerase